MVAIAPVFPAVEGLEPLLDEVRQTLEIAGDPKQVDGGVAEFEVLRDRIAGDRPEVGAVLTLLWQEAVTSRRSCNFWREVSDVEKELAARIAENSFQQK